MDAVNKGTLDAAWVSPMFFYGKDTAFALIDGPPFGPSPARYAQWRRDRDVAKTVDTLYRSFGVKGILCDVRGPYADLWSRSVIGKPADLSGRKIRATGVKAEIFSAAGANVIMLPAGEFYPALSTGVIDAIQYLDPASDIQLGFHKVTKNLYYPGNITPVAGYDLIINVGKWDALPRETQSVLQEACKRNVQDALNSNAAEQQAALASLASKERVRVEELPASVVSALRAAWQKVAEQKSSNPVFRDLLESSRRFEKGG
jgi:TRAP-type mannitol/chloroaromatic compound transport system substrate-binding protein